MSPLHRALLAALLLPLAGCGAGLVTAAVAGNNGDNGGSRPPSLSLPEQTIPLVPVPATARTVVIANAQLAPTAGQSLVVQLRVLKDDNDETSVVVAHNQATPVILSGQGSSTVIGFGLDVAPIAAVTGRESDVTTARLAVLVAGNEVGRPVPVRLLRQPSLRLYDGPQLFLSPQGQSVRFAMKGLRSAATGIQVSVTTVDITGFAPFVTRPCLRPAFTQPGPADPPLEPGEQLVTAEVPSNTFSGPARFFVDDAVAGRSELVAGAFYRPDAAVATPAQGATGGGTRVTLRGTALAPLIAGVTPGEPDFDRLEILFRKGGPGVPERVLPLNAVHLIRADSTLDGIVFEMPPSPDGRTGNVSIVLRAHLQATTYSSEVTAEIVADGVFLYGNPEPVFSPRGIVLANAPITVAPLALEGAPHSTQATDFGVLYSNGNFAKLQLLLSQENGMFIRYYGPELQIGNAAVDSEREPRDLVSGDFDGDGTPDLLIVNAGLSSATHQIVLGQPAPAAPLGAVVRFSTAPGMARARVADLDRDGRDDVVLFPGAGAAPTQRPIVLLQRSTRGAPAFAAPIEVPVRPYATEAFEVADIDGDGLLDVAVAAAGTQMHVDIAYGDGAGSFALSAFQLDLALPGYTPAAGSPAAGLHALGAAPCTLALLLAGLPAEFSGTPPVLGEHPTTPPRLLQLRPNGPRSYAPPLGSDLVVIEGAIDPLRSSLAVNFDGIGTGRDELLVGTSGEAAAFSLGFFRLDAQRRLVLTNLLDGFDGKEKQIDAMFLGIAFPADPGRGQAEVPAVFMKHDVTVDGQLERRLSTLLLERGTVLRLLSPDVGFSTPLGATQDLQGVVGGRFSAAGIASGGAARDLAAPATHLIQLGDNNGFGALAAGNQMVWNGLVPETTTLLPGPASAGDSLVFFDDGTRDGRGDGQLRIGTWQPRTGPGSPATQQPTSFSVDLRPLLPTGLSGASIDPSSHLFAADVDGDQIVDLTVLLRFLQRRTEGEALLMVLRGRAGSGPTEFPFLLPHSAAITPVHGSATAFALGDFVLESSQEPVRLELALAVPTSSNSTVDDGNHVRFYRLTTIAGDPAWRRSFATGGAAEGARVLIAGDRPTRLVASDMDGDGTVDLLVASDDQSLHLFKNSGAPAPDPADVAIEDFVESSGPSPRIPDGRPTNMLLGDINGDGNVDALLATELTRSDGTLTSSVLYYLSSGDGQLLPFTRVSPTRLGDRNARLAVDLGDINSDGVPDLSIGWFPSLTGGAGGNNLIVLLGGSN